MKTTLSATSLLLVLATALTLTLSPAQAQPAKDGMLLHVSSGPDQPHRVLMAMKMASIMAGDHDVLMYFDIEGVKVVLKDAPEIKMEPFGSAGDLLAELRSKGVILMACPSCLQVAGKSADDLAEGVRTANKSEFFTFTKGRIVTLDY